jgi:GNAT superfamily N-acetyltransferase
MLELSPAQAATLADWFQPERPGPLVGTHLVLTGCGQAWADRWPDPRALLVGVAGNYSLLGDPAALRSADLPPLAGVIEAPVPFVPLLFNAYPDLFAWERVIYALPASVALPPLPQPVRRLGPADAASLAGLAEEFRWIYGTWGGPAELAASGYAWGAFVEGRLASVADTFFLGRQHEDIGGITAAEYRGQGLMGALATALIGDMRARGHTPTVCTSTENAARRTTERLGFVLQRHDFLYVTGLVAG